MYSASESMTRSIWSIDGEPVGRSLVPPWQPVRFRVHCEQKTRDGGGACAVTFSSQPSTTL